IPGYAITQPGSLSAPAGGPVTLPCNFTYPPDIEPVGDVRVYWRRGGFHGEFIYNHTERFTHPDYGGRIVLVGDPRGSRTASIRIDRLRESDASEYVCQVRVQEKKSRWEQWRGVTGTNLTSFQGTLDSPAVSSLLPPHGGKLPAPRTGRGTQKWSQLAWGAPRKPTPGASTPF
uniref:Ig-like domain-containing protein n=1 Tax=Chelydra serpentina TaxID=8475 RepID=A0A8C3SMN7_CHESE